MEREFGETQSQLIEVKAKNAAFNESRKDQKIQQLEIQVRELTRLND